MIYYCTDTMGGTSRGVGILKALGEGVLVTPYRIISRYEQLPWFRQVPHPLDDDVLIYDRIADYRNRGQRIVVGQGGDVDLVIDWPVLPYHPADLDMNRARRWWTAPVEAGGCPVVTGPKVLGCRGGRSQTVQKFRTQVPENVRLVTYHPGEFYWPAIELMLYADEVIGERQVQNEWAVIRGEADPDGARRAASEIRRLLGR